MKIVFKFLKRTTFLIIGIIAILAIVAFSFIQLSPQFGGQVTEQQKESFEKLNHYQNGIFTNAEPFTLKMDCHSITEMLKEMLRSKPHIQPDKNVEVVPFDVSTLNQSIANKARVVWLGHSSFLIHIDDQVILIDPIFSDYAAPHKMLGRKRYNDKMPFDIMDLDRIDAVIISHDHYDHLDYPTISQIKDKIQQVIVPLGVGNHFREWGFAAEKINELDWWDETTLGDLTIACTPSRHSSGRGISDQSATLWSSWCLLGQNQKIYFSGDGGYGKHFKEIGAKYGPFDFGMVECGQYNDNWAGIHMVPEESVQAGLDVRAASFMPIHWGAFTLANHTWTDPVERFTKKAKELNATISTPSIGQSIEISSATYPHDAWWEAFNE